jgi:hypothetical protein
VTVVWETKQMIQHSLFLGYFDIDIDTAGAGIFMGPKFFPDTTNVAIYLAISALELCTKERKGADQLATHVYAKKEHFLINRVRNFMLKLNKFYLNCRPHPT